MMRKLIAGYILGGLLLGSGFGYADDALATDSSSGIAAFRQKWSNLSIEERQAKIQNFKKNKPGRGMLQRFLSNNPELASQWSKMTPEQKQEKIALWKSEHADLMKEFQEKRVQWQSLSPEERKQKFEEWKAKNPEKAAVLHQFRQNKGKKHGGMNRWNNLSEEEKQQRLNNLKQRNPEKAALLEKWDTMSDEEKQALKKQWKQNHKGSGKKKGWFKQGWKIKQNSEAME
jgi:hypothetical protein